MKTAIFFAIAASALLTGSYAATAGESDHARYKIVQFPINQIGKPAKVLFLDQRTGTLWSWSEAEGTTYLPGILQPGNPPTFARIIRVER